MRQGLLPFLVLTTAGVLVWSAAPRLFEGPGPAIPAFVLPGAVAGRGDPPQPEPAPSQPVPVVEPVPAAPAPTQPAPAPPEPEIRWYSRGIGLPLASDDPAAQGKKVAMLTFDDGPSQWGSTAKVLDVLKEQNVRAMFFITGLGVRNRDLVERIHREGHVLAPHTMSHVNLTKVSPEEMHKEIKPLVELIEAVTGEKPKYFRPPHGAYNADVLNVLKSYELELLNWTNGSLDWQHHEPEKVVEEVMKQLHRGAVILLHDTKTHTADALPELIRQVRESGYEFVVLR